MVKVTAKTENTDRRRIETPTATLPRHRQTYSDCHAMPTARDGRTRPTGARKTHRVRTSQASGAFWPGGTPNPARDGSVISGRQHRQVRQWRGDMEATGRVWLVRLRPPNGLP